MMFVEMYPLHYLLYKRQFDNFDNDIKNTTNGRLC